jgi:hypothetical protein
LHFGLETALSCFIDFICLVGTMTMALFSQITLHDAHLCRVSLGFTLSRTSDEMREASRVIPYKRYGAMQDEAARKEVADICSKFVSASNAIDFAISYIECLLTIPRISITNLLINNVT